MGLQQRQVFEDLLTTQEREVLHLCKLQRHRRQVDRQRQRRPPSLHLELANKGGRTETAGNNHVQCNALFLSLLFIFSLSPRLQTSVLGGQITENHMKSENFYSLNLFRIVKVNFREIGVIQIPKE